MASQHFPIITAGGYATFQSLPSTNDAGAHEVAGVLANFTGSAQR